MSCAGPVIHFRLHIYECSYYVQPTSMLNRVSNIIVIIK